MNINNTKLKILEIIKIKGSISRIDLSRELDFTPAAISKIIKELIDKQIVLEITLGNSTGGRKPILLTLNEDKFGYILGVSYAPTYFQITVGDIKGNIIETSRYSITNIETILNDSIKKIEKKFKRYPNINVLSVVVNGFLNSKTGMSIFSPHYKWKKLNIKKIFEDKFDIPVIVENDVRAMSLAEKNFGSCKKCDNFVLINISEGIGSSIFLDGDLHSGYGFIAGEIGHIIMDRSSIRKCSCGKRGCLEAEASNTAIINKLTSQIKLNNYSLLKEPLKINGKITMEDVLYGVKERDFLSTKVSTEAITIIAHAIDMVISLINPEKIILVGELFQEPFLFNTLTLEIEKVILEEQKYEILTSDLFKDMHTYCSIATVIHKMFKDEKFTDKFLNIYF